MTTSRAAIGVQGEACILHPDGREDVFSEEVAEGSAAHPLHRFPDPIDVDAVIPSFTRIEGQRQHQRSVLARDDAWHAGLLHIAAHLGVPDVIDEARRMRDQVPQGDRPPRWAQPRLTRGVEAFEYLWRGELWQHLGDRPVERELPLFHEPQRRRRGYRLCHRGDPKHRICGHRRSVR
jgi:hypothetical protein